MTEKRGTRPAKTLRLTAVQAAPVFLDREATTAKAVALIEEAGAAGSDIVGFPESFIPAHPLWYHFHPASGAKALLFAQRLAQNAVEIESATTRRLAAAARKAGTFVVMGVCEREPGRPGTLYNTLQFIDAKGQLVGRHRKLVPTLGERLVHAPGDARGLRAYMSGDARVGGLMCAENSNPLATFALDAQGVNVHVAAWPSHFSLGADMRNAIEMITRALAFQMKTFIVNAVGEVDDRIREELPATDEDRAFLDAQGGGASIIGPWGESIAGPAPAGEQLVHADVSLANLVVPKLIQDFGGHYNRFDLFQLSLDSGGYGPLAGPGPRRRSSGGIEEERVPAELGESGVALLEAWHARVAEDAPDVGPDDRRLESGREVDEPGPGS